MKDFKKDPELYRRMSVPFESRAVALEAIEAFINGVRELREEHGIPDLYSVIAFSYKDATGKEYQNIVPFMTGDMSKAVALAGFAFGYETQEQETQRLHSVAEGKKSAK